MLGYGESPLGLAQPAAGESRRARPSPCNSRKSSSSRLPHVVTISSRRRIGLKPRQARVVRRQLATGARPHQPVCRTYTSRAVTSDIIVAIRVGFVRWPKPTSGSSSRRERLPSRGWRLSEESVRSGVVDPDRRRARTSRAHAGRRRGRLGYLRKLPAATVRRRATRIRWPRSGLTRSRRWSQVGELDPARAYLDAYEASAARWSVHGAWRAPRAAAGCSAASEGDLAGAFAAFELCPHSRSRSSPFRSSAAAPYSAWARAPTGAAEEGRERSARAGARDLRGVGRAALGGEGPSRARRISGRRVSFRRS